ncbi:glycosyltransferase [Quadrisphaera sp. DSM 44207]|uniref:glycosyltransferase n=1 Tax=Quadrisphaera sp. DSM 44207 TaxID=1881057 RepID=UPI00087F7DCC|nr:glycosyltransferase [Quadrisphaera sp. DSM 44207]SDQ10044.1 Glycosyltransferase, GT2 family [Quadrisphaera sp. DSM 44207]
MGAACERVVAVVVAFDRRELLVRVLQALAAQTRPLDCVVVLDNASSDGSAEAARRAAADLAVPVDVVALPRNTGGAGGFAAGLARAITEHAADWVWLMDDDTVPTPTALEQLLAARDAHPGEVAVLASRVVWHDGREHPMNTPRRRPLARAAARAGAASAGAVPVRSASFVSLLVDAEAVRADGLPVADYFIWNDDFEFTTRLLRARTGLHCPASVVVHETRVFGGTDVDPGPRFYFEVRNKVWLFTRSGGLAPWEKALYGGSTLLRWARTLAGSSQPRVLLAGLRRGLADGLRRRPRPTSQVLEGLGAVSAAVVAVEAGAGR